MTNIKNLASNATIILLGEKFNRKLTLKSKAKKKKKVLLRIKENRKKIKKNTLKLNKKNKSHLTCLFLSTLILKSMKRIIAPKVPEEIFS